MINNVRKKEILEYLSDVEYRTLNDLAKKCNVSMNTIRRDINELAEENYVQKFYGGVSLVRKKDSTYENRITSNLKEKQRIAAYAASLVQDNDIIFIDSGSTTSLLVDYMDPNYKLTIVTNNLHIVSKIIQIEQWDLIMVGSNLRHSSQSLINVHNWDYLDSLNLNKAFIAATGLTIKSGATNTDNGETIIKTQLMKRSNESYLMLDSSKFDQTSLITFAKIEDFCKIITSGSIPEHYTQYFKDNNIQIKIT